MPPTSSSDQPAPTRQVASSEGGTPIAWLLPLVLAALVLATVVPVVLLGFLGARDNTNRLLGDRSELVLDILVDRLEGHLEPVRAQLAYAAEAVRRGALDVRDEAAVTSYLAGALAAVPQVNGITFVRPDGTARRHNRAGHSSFDETAAMLPAAQRSIAENRTEPGLRWVGPLWSTALRQPILGARVALRGPGDEDRGLLVATVSVTELSRPLAEMAKDTDRTPFILAGRDRVLAHPALVTPEVENRSEPQEPLPPIETFKDPVLARIWTRQANPLPFVQRSQGHWSWFGPGSLDANSYVYRAIPDYGAEPWIVGVHAPSTDTRRARWIVIGIGAGGLVLLVLSLGAAFLLGRRLGEPVLGLAAAAARVEALDFAGARTLPRGPVREINQAAAAVERMAAGLASFETYVPKTLVRRLMAAGPGAALTETREVTVMFTDLESYSDYASAHPAAEVVSYLNELLTRIGPLIEAGGGTIDKYIGDSVMAFWGAPEDRPDHARAGCVTACAIAREVEALNAARRAEGLHACRMRIGLHTGPVAVGNIGFRGRVDYTIIGRTVNTAQKLEQCGRHATDGAEVVILVSGSTKTAAGPGFSFEVCPDLGVAGAGETARLVSAAA